MKKSICVCVFTIIFTALMACSPFSYVNAANENTPSVAGIVRTSSGALNVRAAASTGSNVVGSVKNGSYISVIEPSGSFYKVLYASGNVGFCHKNYIDLITDSYGAYVNTTSSSLNVRSGPSTAYGIVSSLYKGEAVVVLSSHGGFYKVLYRGTNVGYASSSFVKKRSSGGSSSGYHSVNLNVPSFKQYDSRWSSVRLGNSSKTIYESGCLTTAIAMERSYSYGYTVTPATVARGSSYTSGGSIYWPSSYGFLTGSDYLNTIYSLLKQGKPVIVGAKNKYGGQHWVIVKGFTPNGSLSADDFLINDPGSSTRKTLSSFFSAYPYFYKAAYRK